MNKSDIVTLFEYNYWANQRVLKAAGQVSTEQFIAPAGLSHGSVRGALVHVLAAEVMWRLRCQQGISPRAMLIESEFPTLDDLATRWRAEERDMRDYLAGLTDADLQSALHYTNTKGQSFEQALWQPLAHVVNHGTQFRGEAAVALTRLGHSPGDLDLIAFLRQL